MSPYPWFTYLVSFQVNSKQKLLAVFHFQCKFPRSKYALIKKSSEIKLKKQVILNDSKERHWNLKRTEITLYMKGAFPPQCLALYAKIDSFS